MHSTSDNTSRQCAVLVVGMHRSGTSALTRGLESLGIYIGKHFDFYAPAHDNARGFWENRQILDLNESLLKTLGHQWDTINTPVIDRLDDEYKLDFCRQIKDIINQNFAAHPVWGVKDPRISRLLPFWLGVLDEMHIHPFLVLTVRNPIDIANSLNSRNGFDEDKSVLLCLAYWLDILKSCRDVDHTIIEYNELVDHTSKTMMRLGENIGIKPSGDATLIEIERYTNNFIHAGLRHHRADAKQEAAWIQRGGIFATAIHVYHHLILPHNKDDAAYERLLEDITSQIADAQGRIMEIEATGVRISVPKTRIMTNSPSRTDDRAELALSKHHYNTQSLTSILSDVLPNSWHPFLRKVKRRLFPPSIKPDSKPAMHFSSMREMIGSATGYDVIVFPVIDWYFRIQRPQHIAMGFASAGHRVFYLTTAFHNNDSTWTLHERADKNIFLCTLAMPPPHPVIYHGQQSSKQKDDIVRSLNRMLDDIDARQVVAIVDHPFWCSVAEAIPGGIVVYDCMDHHAGFIDNTDAVLDNEARLIETADLVITSSQPLSEIMGKKRTNTLIRNAADSVKFRNTPDQIKHDTGRPVVGYFGAISEWFDIDLVVRAAKTYPDCDFLLVGSTYMCNTAAAKKQDNIYLVGEVTYAELTGYLYSFDICLIPFIYEELTRCTNPVKLYEYLASGKPVVTTDMPELRMVSDYIYFSDSDDRFIENIRRALDEKADDPIIEARKQYAMANRWEHRVEQFSGAITALFRSVSIIVLTYNNLEYTRACLHSIEQYTDYDDYELIIVDNASSDGTSEFLTEYACDRQDVKVILNDENVGVPAGNNIGIRAATGDYIVILNNDTYVTRGWLWGMLRYFLRDDTLGLIGPVTNNIGNEAKIDIEYSNMWQMCDMSRTYTQQHSRELLSVNTIAFFCTMIRRAVIEDIGLLDETFGKAFFEDDDYCKRVRHAGYSIKIAEDVFVHHHLSASLNNLGLMEKQRLFEESKTAYELKWGEWKPHKYRQMMSERYSPVFLFLSRLARRVYSKAPLTVGFKAKIRKTILRVFPSLPQYLSDHQTKPPTENTISPTGIAHAAYDSDKVSSYFKYYQPFLEPIRQKPVFLLELGIHKGGSLLFWQDYMPLATIAGIDLALPQVIPERLSRDRVHMFKGDQTDTAFLTMVADKIAPNSEFDIIIDDACHLGYPTKLSFWHLFDNHLKSGGIYVIEDWGTGYWDSYEDGKTVDPKTHDRTSPVLTSHMHGMVGFIKQLIDEVAYGDIVHEMAGKLPHKMSRRDSKFESMTIYRGAAFIKKRQDKETIHSKNPVHGS